MVAQKYATFDEGGIPHSLINDLDDDVTILYATNVDMLLEKVDSVKKNMHKNMLQHMQNIESAEILEQKSSETLELAKIFKKNAKKLNSEVKKKSWVPVATVAAVGGTVGFLAGGPAGACILTGMASISAAQAIEAGLAALIFSVGFLGAQSSIDSWTVNQHFARL